MLFPMSETFNKSQLSEFFDVSSWCVSGVERKLTYERLYLSAEPSHLDRLICETVNLMAQTRKDFTSI